MPCLAELFFCTQYMYVSTVLSNSRFLFQLFRAFRVYRKLESTNNESQSAVTRSHAARPYGLRHVTGALCLLPQRDARFFSGVLPLFSRCFNRTCLELAHEPLGTAPHTASGHASNGEFGMLRGGLTSTPITEFRCGASGIDELHAVERVHAALRARPSHGSSSLGCAHPPRLRPPPARLRSSACAR